MKSYQFLNLRHDIECNLEYSLVSRIKYFNKRELIGNDSFFHLPGYFHEIELFESEDRLGNESF